MSDSLAQAVSDLKDKIAEHVTKLKENHEWREIQRLFAGLGVLEELCEQPKTDLATLLGVASDTTLRIGKFEFAGQPPLQAAKAYLRKLNAATKETAASLDAIITALESGGLKVNRDDLRISLSRSTYEVYKVGEDAYGLVEYFPHIKRGGKKKASNGDPEEPPATAQGA